MAQDSYPTNSHTSPHIERGTFFTVNPHPVLLRMDRPTFIFTLHVGLRIIYFILVAYQAKCWKISVVIGGGGWWWWWRGGGTCLCLKVFLLWSASSNSEEFNMLAKINMYPNIAGQATLLGKLSQAYMFLSQVKFQGQANTVILIVPGTRVSIFIFLTFGIFYLHQRLDRPIH